MARKNMLVRTDRPDVKLNFRLIGHLERPEELASCTYVIKPPTIDQKFYITISDHKVEGELRPFEMFISSKHTEGFEATQALMRIVSSRFQEPGPFPGFLIGELLDTFSPDGGYFISESWLRESTGVRKANGLFAHIGLVLLHHCKKLGLKL